MAADWRSIDCIKIIFIKIIKIMIAQWPTHFKMRRRISIRGCVRPSVRRTVGRSGTPSLIRVLGASCAVYPALFFCSLLSLPIACRTFKFARLFFACLFAHLLTNNSLFCILQYLVGTLGPSGYLVEIEIFFL